MAVGPLLGLCHTNTHRDLSLAEVQLRFVKKTVIRIHRMPSPRILVCGTENVGVRAVCHNPGVNDHAA